jgi:hypothetical protein
MTPKSLFAVVAGAGIGAIAAVGLRQKEPVETKPPPLAPAAAVSFETPSPPTPAPLASTGALPEIGPPVAGAATAARDASMTGDASTVLAVALEENVPIGTKAEFDSAALACNEKHGVACRRAAAAAELGAVVPKDTARAKTFRMIELTLLVRGCDKNSVAACLTLADRYLRGDFVEKNERTASALIERAKELCEKRPDDACRDVPAD